jgi:hypothetical protein
LGFFFMLLFLCFFFYASSFSWAVFKCTSMHYFANWVKEWSSQTSDSKKKIRCYEWRMSYYQIMLSFLQNNSVLPDNTTFLRTWLFCYIKQKFYIEKTTKKKCSYVLEYIQDIVMYFVSKLFKKEATWF